MYKHPLFNMVKLRSLVDASTFLSVTDTCLSFCLQANGQIYSLYGSRVCCNGILGVWGEVEEQGHVWVFLGCLQMLSHKEPAVFWWLAVLSPKWPCEERRTGFCLKALCAARRKWLCLFKLSCPLWACLAMWDKRAKSVPQSPPPPIPCVFLRLNSSHPVRLGAGEPWMLA